MLLVCLIWNASRTPVNLLGKYNYKLFEISIDFQEYDTCVAYLVGSFLFSGFPIAN